MNKFIVHSSQFIVKQRRKTVNRERITNNSSGISFLELILVIALITILAAMSPIFYSRFLLQNAVANTSDQLVGSLRKAQLYSMMSKQADGWSVNFSSNTITLYKGSTFLGHDSSFDEKFELNPNVTVAGFSDISFSKAFGLPSSTPTITISSGNNSDVITVNNQGVASR